jgi:hypothetical protein
MRTVYCFAREARAYARSGISLRERLHSPVKPSLGLFKHSANSRTSPLKQGQSPRSLGLSAKDLRRLGRKLAARDTRSRRSAKKRLVPGRLCGASNASLENAELLNGVGVGWGPTPIGKETSAATRFPRRRNSLRAAASSCGGQARRPGTRCFFALRRAPASDQRHVTNPMRPSYASPPRGTPSASPCTLPRTGS